MEDSEVILKCVCFDKNKYICLNMYENGFLDSSGCPKTSILISSVQFREVNSEWDNRFSSTRILETFVINIWHDVLVEGHSRHMRTSVLIAPH